MAFRVSVKCARTGNDGERVRVDFGTPSVQSRACEFVAEPASRVARPNTTALFKAGE